MERKKESNLVMIPESRLRRELRIAERADPSETAGTESSMHARAEPSVHTRAESSVDTRAESSVDMGAESSVNTKAESSVDMEAESSVNTKAESSVDTKADSSVDMGAESSVNTKAESSVDMEAESSVNTKAESSVHARADSSVDTRAESSMHAKAEPSVDMEADSSVDTKAESSVHAKAEPSVDTKAESSMHARADSSVDMGAESSVNTKAESSVDTKAESSVNTKAESSVDTKAESSVDTKAESSVNMEAESSVDTEAESSVDTEAESSVNMEAESSVDTEAESSVDTEAEPSVDTKAESNVHARAEPSVDTKAEPIVHARADSSVDTRAESRVDIGAESSVHARADSSVDTRAESSVHARADSSVGTRAESSVHARADSSVDTRAESCVDIGAESSVHARADSSVDMTAKSSVDIIREKTTLPPVAFPESLMAHSKRARRFCFPHRCPEGLISEQEKDMTSDTLSVYPKSVYFYKRKKLRKRVTKIEPPVTDVGHAEMEESQTGNDGDQTKSTDGETKMEDDQINTEHDQVKMDWNETKVKHGQTEPDHDQTKMENAPAKMDQINTESNQVKMDWNETEVKHGQTEPDHDQTKMENAPAKMEAELTTPDDLREYSTPDDGKTELDDEESNVGDNQNETDAGWTRMDDKISLDSLIENMDFLLDLYKNDPEASIAMQEKKNASWPEDSDMKKVEVKSEQNVLNIYDEFIDSFEKCLKEHAYEKAKDVVNEAMKRVELKDQRQNTLAKLYFISLEAWDNLRDDEQCRKNIHKDDKQSGQNVDEDDEQCRKNKHDDYEQFRKNVHEIMSEILAQAVILREEYKPTTIEEAFHQGDWSAMKEMYESQKGSLSKEKMNLVAILAAKNSAWGVFDECLESGANIVKTKRVTSAKKTTSTEDICTPVQGFGMKQVSPTSASTLSPLHEALKTGGFLLEDVKSYFEEDVELVNAVDQQGNSLLGLVITYGQSNTIEPNLQFLLDHKVNVNVKVDGDKTALQCLAHPRKVDLMIKLVNDANLIASESWRPSDDGWTALHVLCTTGNEDQLVKFMKKGAAPRELRNGLTLIDTVILSNSTPQEKKHDALKILLEELHLSEYHAQKVQERTSSSKKNYDLQACYKGKFYQYPVEHLLLPPISSRPLRVMYRKFIELLIAYKAISEHEKEILRSKLPLAEKEYQGLEKLLEEDKDCNRSENTATTDNEIKCNQMEILATSYGIIPIYGRRLIERNVTAKVVPQKEDMTSDTLSVNRDPSTGKPLTKIPCLDPLPIYTYQVEKPFLNQRRCTNTHMIEQLWVDVDKSQTKTDHDQTKRDDGETKMEDDQTNMGDDQTNTETGQMKMNCDKTKVEDGQTQPDHDKTKMENAPTSMEVEESTPDDLREYTTPCDGKTELNDEENKVDDNQNEKCDGWTKLGDKISLDILIENMKFLLDLYKNGPHLVTAVLEKNASWLKDSDLKMVEVKSEEKVSKIYQELIDSFKTHLKEHEYEKAKDIVNEAMERVELKNHRQYTLAKLHFMLLEAWTELRRDEQSEKTVHKEKECRKNVDEDEEQRAKNVEDDKQCRKNTHEDYDELKKNVHEIMTEILKQAVILREEYKPTTIEEAFHQRDWPAMAEMHESQKGSLSKEKLNLVAILAAKNSAWGVFEECLENGADIVKTKQVKLTEKPTSTEDYICTHVRGFGMKTVSPISASTLSPLHEALKTGEFLLQNVKLYFEEDTELVNAVDQQGNSLLGLVITYGRSSTIEQNLQFLLDRKVNVNVKVGGDKTALQCLTHPRKVDLMIKLVNGAEKITDESWRPGDDGWTALHVLCATGHHDQLLQFKEKGADPEKLLNGLTLIDTVILNNTIPLEKKLEVLKILLKELALGKYHAQMVHERVFPLKTNYDLQSTYKGNLYQYPVEHLLLPPVSSRPLCVMYRKLIELLIAYEAVSEHEKEILRSKLSLAEKEYQGLEKFLEQEEDRSQSEIGAATDKEIEYFTYWVEKDDILNQNLCIDRIIMKIGQLQTDYGHAEMDESEIKTGDHRKRDGGETKMEDGQTNSYDDQTNKENDLAKMDWKETKLEDGHIKPDHDQTKMENGQTKMENELTKPDDLREYATLDGDKAELDDEETKMDYNKNEADDGWTKVNNIISLDGLIEDIEFLLDLYKRGQDLATSGWLHKDSDLKKVEVNLEEKDLEIYHELVDSFQKCLHRSEYEKAKDIVKDGMKRFELKDHTQYALAKLYFILLEALNDLRSYKQSEKSVHEDDGQCMKNAHDDYEEFRKHVQEVMSEILKRAVILRTEYIPTTIEEAFHQGDWSAMTEMYESQKGSLSKEKLNLVTILAAKKCAWAVFDECLKQGADFVKTKRATPTKNPSSTEDNICTHVRGFGMKKANPTSASTFSPLHEALKTGIYLLENVKSYFEEDPDLVNAVDQQGDSLLGLVIRCGRSNTIEQNLQFLLDRKVNVNVNVKADGDKTALQCLAHPRKVDLMIKLVNGAEEITDESWRPGDDGWTALHVLCATGHNDELMPFTEKGADPKELHNGLTLIDTVILANTIPLEKKQEVLKTLLKELALGEYHAEKVQERVHSLKINYELQMTYEGKLYRYPVEHLLLPLISSRPLRMMYRKFIELMIAFRAISEHEKEILMSKLPSVEKEYQGLEKLLQQDDHNQAQTLSSAEKKAESNQTLSGETKMEADQTHTGDDQTQTENDQVKMDRDDIKVEDGQTKQDLDQTKMENGQSKMEDELTTPDDLREYTTPDDGKTELDDEESKVDDNQNEADDGWTKLDNIISLDILIENMDNLLKLHENSPEPANAMHEKKNTDWLKDSDLKMDEVKSEEKAPKIYQELVDSFEKCLNERKYEEAMDIVNEAMKRVELKNHRQCTLAKLFFISRKARTDLQSYQQSKKNVHKDDKQCMKNVDEDDEQCMKNVHDDYEEFRKNVHEVMSEILKQAVILREEYKPTTIEEAFHRGDWSAMTEMYGSQKGSLSKEKLNLVAISAAKKCAWAVFDECLKQGADFVKTKQATPTRNPSSTEDNICTHVRGFGMKKANPTSASTLSPLHEALKTGRYLLENVKSYFEEDPDLVNAVDQQGDSLLGLVIRCGRSNTIRQNLQFLLDSNVNVNVKADGDKTALQCVACPRKVDLMIKLVNGAEEITDECWQPGDDGWTALHVLCATGNSDQLVKFKEKGADPRDLRSGLTLVDTVILSNSIDLQEKGAALKILLGELHLGEYHAQKVQERVHPWKGNYHLQMTYNGKLYRYPVEHLLLPPISSHPLRLNYRQFIELLLDKEAVSDHEKGILRSKLPLAEKEYQGLEKLLEQVNHNEEQKLSSTDKQAKTNRILNGETNMEADQTHTGDDQTQTENDQVKMDCDETKAEDGQINSDHDQTEMEYGQPKKEDELTTSNNLRDYATPDDGNIAMDDEKTKVDDNQNEKDDIGTKVDDIVYLDILIENMEFLLELYKSGPDLATVKHEQNNVSWLKDSDLKMLEAKSEERSFEIYLGLVDSFEKCLYKCEYEEAKDIVSKAMKRVELKDHRQYTLAKLYFVSLESWNDLRVDEQCKKNDYKDDEQCRQNADEDYEQLRKNVQEVMSEILKQAVSLRTEYKPTTIEEAFHQRDWPVMKEMYESQKGSLSKEKLNLVAILAAKNSAWGVFDECIESGADIVKAKQVMLSEKPTSTEDYICTHVRGFGMKKVSPTSASTLSPLHEALKTGRYLLENVKLYFEEDPDLVNAVDQQGNSLLGLVISYGRFITTEQNIQFLLDRKVNVNVRVDGDKTALQVLADPRRVNLMIKLVNGLEKITDECWRPGDDGWTALHVLCATGHYDQLMQFKEKGADPRELHNGLTLVDTVILNNTVEPLKKEEALKILLEEMALGKYHAEKVQERDSPWKTNSDLQSTYKGKLYQYPVEHLLLPPVSSRPLRLMYRKFIELLFANEAVSELEKGILRSKLPLAEKEYQGLEKLLEEDQDCNQSKNVANADKGIKCNQTESLATKRVRILRHRLRLIERNPIESLVECTPARTEISSNTDKCIQADFLG